DVVDAHDPARARDAAVAADRDRNGSRLLGRCAERNRGCRTAVAATTTNALREDAVGVRPSRDDVTVLIDRDEFAVAGGSAVATTRNRDLNEIGAESERRSAVAATTADALCVNADGAIGLRHQRAEIVDRHRAAIAAGTALPATRNRRDGHTDRRRIAAVAAATADALREDCRRAIAVDDDRAVICNVDGLALAAVGIFAADRLRCRSGAA